MAGAAREPAAPGSRGARRRYEAPAEEAYRGRSSPRSSRTQSKALEAYREVLEGGVDDEVIAAVRDIGETREELRIEAADVLEPVLRAAGKQRPLADVLEMRLRAQTEPAERAQTLRAIAAVAEALGDSQRAQEAPSPRSRRGPQRRHASRRDRAHRRAARCGWLVAVRRRAVRARDGHLRRSVDDGSLRSPRTRSPRRSFTTMHRRRRRMRKQRSTRVTRPRCSRRSTDCTRGLATRAASRTCSSGGSPSRPMRKRRPSCYLPHRVPGAQGVRREEEGPLDVARRARARARPRCEP